MSLEFVITGVLTLLAAMGGWTLRKVVTIDKSLASVETMMAGRDLLIAERFERSLERATNIEAQILAMRARLHKLEGSVLHRERDVLELLDRLQKKLDVERVRREGEGDEGD